MRRFFRILTSSRRRSSRESHLQRIRRFRSRLLPTERDLWVYRPPDFDRRASYPVLLMQDGQNLFDPETAFIRGEHWGVREAADQLIGRKEIVPLVIIGIANTGPARIDEYTPTRVLERKAGGKADLYGTMLLDEILPFVCDRFLIRAEPRHGIAGSSLGGLLSLHLGLQQPERFNRVAALSPSVWWDDRVIVDQVQQFDRNDRFKLWLDFGSAEGEEGIRHVELLRDALLAKGWRAGVDLSFTVVEGGDHSERSWAQRFSDVLRFLYGASN